MLRRPSRSVVAVLGLTLACASAHAQSAPADFQSRRLEQGVDIEERLGATLPLDVAFTDHRGEAVTLARYFDGERPVVLNFAYHSCRVLCSMVLRGTLDALREVDWRAGERYRFVSVSIDPRDTPARAAEKRAQSLVQYGRGSVADEDFAFLVGDEASVRRVADAVGFRYFYDARQDQYAHSAAMVLLTPAARVGRYLYGFRYASSDVRLALLDVSEGRTLSTGERLVLYCYDFDPNGGGYALAARRIMQAGGGLTALGVGLFLFVMWRRERRKRRTEDGAGPAAPASQGQVARL